MDHRSPNGRCVASLKADMQPHQSQGSTSGVPIPTSGRDGPSLGAYHPGADLLLHQLEQSCRLGSAAGWLPQAQGLGSSTCARQLPRRLLACSMLGPQSRSQGTLVLQVEDLHDRLGQPPCRRHMRRGQAPCQGSSS